MSDQVPPGSQVLVIDDDPSLQTLVVSMLNRIGVQATTALTAVEGLNMLADLHFDLLVLDLMLPDIDGFEVLRALRMEKQYNYLPIIILSAMADPDAIRRGFDLGADGYITKPYLPHSLADRVTTLLIQGRKTDEPPAPPAP